MTVADPQQVDYYELVGVPPNASSEAVDAALARQYSLWEERSTLPRRADRAYAEWVLDHLGEAERVLNDPARREEYNAARRQLPVLEAAGAEAGTWHDRAQHFLDEDNPTAAERVANEALASLPGRPLPWLVRGYASALREEYADAEYELAEAARLMPHVALPKFLLGELHAAQQKWETALARYEEALALSPASAPMIAAKAEALLANGEEAAEAVRLLKPLVEKHPGDIVYASVLAQAYRQQVMARLTPVPGSPDRRIWTSEDHIHQLHATATRIARLRCEDSEVKKLVHDLRQFAEEGSEVHWDTNAPSIFVGFGIILFLWGCGIGVGTTDSLGVGFFLGLLISGVGAGGLFALLRRKPAWKLAAEAVGKGNLSARIINARNRAMGAVYRTFDS